MHVFGVFLSAALFLQTHGSQYEHQNRRDPLLRSKMRNATRLNDVGGYPITGSLQKVLTVTEGNVFRKHICTGTQIDGTRALVPVTCVLPVILQVLFFEKNPILQRQTTANYTIWNVDLSRVSNDVVYKLFFYVPQFKTHKITQVRLPEHPGKWRPNGFSAKLGADFRSEPTEIYSTGLAIVEWSIPLKDLAAFHRTRILGPYRHMAKLAKYRSDLVYAKCHIQTLGYNPQNQFNKKTLATPKITSPSIMPVEILSESDCKKDLDDYFSIFATKSDILRPNPNAICVKMLRSNSGICRGDEGAPIFCKTRGSAYLIVGVIHRNFFLKQTETCKPLSFYKFQKDKDASEHPIPVTGHSLMPGKPLAKWVHAAGLHYYVNWLDWRYWSIHQHFLPDWRGYRFLTNFTLPQYIPTPMPTTTLPFEIFFPPY